MDQALESLRERISRLSGAGKRGFPERRKKGIYTSFTVPELADMQALRDTKIRMRAFAIPSDLTGKTVIDVGSNVGAVSAELARRGASVVGVEYNGERVELARDIAERFNLKAEFHAADFRSLGDEPWIKEYDVVFCCSVDEYLDDVDEFYKLLRRLCSGTLYFESNIQKGASETETMGRLAKAGFADVTYLGNGHSGGVSRKRKLFRAAVRTGT